MSATVTCSFGSCLCGAVRIAAQLPSKWVAHCHCTFCRRAHGAAFVTWAAFSTEDVRIEDPTSSLHWYASSQDVERGSCARCGSPMLFRSDRWPGETHIARALLDAGLDKQPSEHAFYEAHVSWLDVKDDLPRHRGRDASGA
jgi:hypothetical protein